MSVYVDRLQNHGWRLGESCHLVADTVEELHDFAARIGMKRAWFQAPPKASCPHYDLTASRRARAVQLGAIELGRLDFVNVTRRLRGLPEYTQQPLAKGGEDL